MRALSGQLAAGPCEQIVEVDGKLREMTFITNNFDWAASSIVDLYRCRWAIETFFKEIKQTLQLSDFLGHNKNAVQWQVWTALITYVLLRYHALQHTWQHGFKRFFCLMRSNLWSKCDLASLLEICGTARGINEQGKTNAAINVCKRNFTTRNEAPCFTGLAGAVRPKSQDYGMTM